METTPHGRYSFQRKGPSGEAEALGLRLWAIRKEALPPNVTQPESFQPRVLNFMMEWAEKPLDSMLTIPAELHDVVMALSAEDRRDRAKVNEAVRRYRESWEGDN